MDLQRRIEKFQGLYDSAPRSLLFVPLADLLGQAGRHDEALLLLRTGLIEHPDSLAGHVVHGRILRAAGRHGAARTVLERVLERDPENQLVLQTLAELAGERSDWEEAAERYGTLVGLDPEDEDWRLLQAAARARLSELESGDDTGSGSEAPDETTDGSAPVDEDDDPSAGIETSEAPATELPSLATMTLVDIYLAQGYRRRAMELLREIADREGADGEVARRRIAKLDEAGDDPEDHLEMPYPGADDGTGGDRKAVALLDRTRDPAALAAARAAREQERITRRRQEKKQFEEWLNRIRVGGEEGP